MLKGTTKIELTDVNTGETEVIEKHNLVTNAISNLFQPTLGHATDGATLRGLGVSTLMGGLLLFNGTITESATTLFAPAGVDVTGHGIQGVQNTTSGIKLGSYNATESSVDTTARTAKFVYDFSTNQANGTIASVCLSNKMTGYGGYGTDMVYTDTLSQTMMGDMYTGIKYLIDSENKYDTSNNLVYGKEYLFLIDEENDIAYYFVITGGTTIKFKKYHTRLKTYSLFETGTATSTLVSAGETPEVQLSTSIPAGTWSYNYDRTDNSIYIRAGGTVANGASFTLTKVTCETTPVVTQTSITNSTGVVIGNTSNRSTFVHNGFVYIMGNASPYNIYKISIATSEVTTIANPSQTYGFFPVIAIDGIIYYQKANSTPTVTATYLVDSESNTMKKCGITNLEYIYQKGTGSTYYYYTPVYTPVKGSTMIYYLSFSNNASISLTGVGFRYFTNYLATINNLATPIAKVNTQTMKVTYTIQEV